MNLAAGVAARNPRRMGRKGHCERPAERVCFPAKTCQKESANLHHVRPAINWRSVTLGLLATIIICSVAYYNDFAVNNTFFIGNNLPLGLVMMTFLFVLLVNGPLSRWGPRYALSSGELVVAFSMALVSCTMPSGGLMRWMPHAIISPWWHGAGEQGVSGPAVVAAGAGLAVSEVLASSDRSNVVQRSGVNGFMQRWTGEGSPPYGAVGSAGAGVGDTDVRGVWRGDVPDGDRATAVGRE